MNQSNAKSKSDKQRNEGVLIGKLLQFKSNVLGIFLFSYGYTSNLLIAISPVIMTYFLIKVSGVSLLERQIMHKKEGYKEYINNTSSFILMPKKNKK